MLCEKLDLDCVPGVNEYDVLSQAVQLGAAVYPTHFEGMAVQMHWMIVCAQILHHQAVALPGLEDWFVGLRVRLPIDPPELFVSMAMELRFEGKIDTNDLVSALVCLARGRELTVVPGEVVRLSPDWFAGCAGVFDHNSHACSLYMLSHFTEYPNAWRVHLDDRADPFGGR